MVKFDDYYLGLDIGTDSVGWAVTDDRYEILDFNGKAMWGIHLFDSGQTAKNRRVYRTARRRLERRKQRIGLLRDLFSPEISKVDFTFFERLDESRFFVEDRKHKQKNSLFNDPSFQDRDLHKRFPTIYHLRDHLSKTSEKEDIRLIYLACHHIVKYRGHFLFEGISDGEVPELGDVFRRAVDLLNQVCGTDVDPSASLPLIESTLLDRGLGIREKASIIGESIADPDHERTVKAFSSLISGSNVDLSLLFDDEDLKSVKVSFKNTDMEEIRGELEERLDPDRILLIELMKQIYDWAALKWLLGDHKNISESKISQFEAHASDLKLLKSVLRRFSDPQTYKEVFKSEEKECNYSAYSGNHKSTSAVKSCNQEDFCKYIKGILKESFKDPLFESGEYYDMKCRLDEGTFMPKQTSKENSLIPNQLHKRELESILHNASKHYPFLCEADESGLTVMDKIMSLCTFRIPYYVGPLGQGSKNNWAVRREEGRVTPWNFEDKIDLDESAVKFIDRLINMCSYLPGEKVIPKSSILYSRFELFNELNTMRINGERISVELKKDIVRDLFENPQNNRKVTKKSIIGYLMRRGLSDGETEISGVDDTIKSSLRSESDMRRILGEGFDRRLADDVIRAIVVFGDDRSRLRKKLETDYSDRLTRDQLDSLSRLQYKDWGRLSERFLTGVRSNIQGVEMNILTALEQTNLNLNEILSDRYGFKKEVDRIRDEQSDSYDGRITYGLVEDLYVSPPVRRGIWRSLRIIEDILKITGHPPAKVFIETTRESGEKTRTVSRKDSLQKLFKSCKEEEWLKRLEGETDGRLRSKKYYSYYTQHGRCMYCGSGIDLNSLGDSNACDMDHIHPRSKKTDDSIHNNMVLVCRECNQRKGDAYPLPQEWQDRMRPFWKHLFENGFITKEKYGRLTRNHGFTEDELSGFIARQIVETSQTVKEVAGVLKKVFGDGTEIVYVKGNAISEFRRNNGFVKCRIVNDYHHAKDAYLNIVIGNAYNVKFTHDPRTFVRSGKDYTLNQERMLRYDIERGGERAWTAGEDGTISVVRKHMRRNNIRFTRFAFEKKGQLFDVNPVKAPNGQHPLKKGLDIDRYGGYNKISGSYFFLVEHRSGKKRIRTLQAVPVLVMNKKENREVISEYLSKERNLEEPRVLIPRILMNSTFEIDGFRLHITGRTNNRIQYTCAEQLILDYDSYDYCKNIYNHTTKSKESRKTLPAEDYGITAEKSILLYDALTEKFRGKKYSAFLGRQSESLASRRDAFLQLTPEEQSEVLNEILHAFQCNSATMNLKKIGGPGCTGMIWPSNNLSKFGSVKLVNQSPSGLFESQKDLMKI